MAQHASQRLVPAHLAPVPPGEEGVAPHVVAAAGARPQPQLRPRFEQLRDEQLHLGRELRAKLQRDAGRHARGQRGARPRPRVEQVQQPAVAPPVRRGRDVSPSPQHLHTDKNI